MYPDPAVVNALMADRMREADAARLRRSVRPARARRKIRSLPRWTILRPRPA